MEDKIPNQTMTQQYLETALAHLHEFPSTHLNKYELAHIIQKMYIYTHNFTIETHRENKTTEEKKEIRIQNQNQHGFFKPRHQTKPKDYLATSIMYLCGTVFLLIDYSINGEIRKLILSLIIGLLSAIYILIHVKYQKYLKSEKSFLQQTKKTILQNQELLCFLEEQRTFWDEMKNLPIEEQIILIQQKENEIKNLFQENTIYIETDNVPLTNKMKLERLKN